MTNWQELLEFADKKDFDVNDFKKNFAEVTKQEVETFKGKIKDEYDQYMSKGPGTPSVSLEEGAELLAASKDKIRSFNRIREENVLAEKLFNLPISKFPELIAMEEANKKYDLIYVELCTSLSCSDGNIVFLFPSISVRTSDSVK